jgi:hypothetical protein
VGFIWKYSYNINYLFLSLSISFRNYLMNWKNFKTQPNKLQFINAGFGDAFDTEFCISFSSIKSVQTELNFKIENRLISVELISWLSVNKYLNAQGQVDLSPRFTGIMAGTTANGTSQENEHISICTDGCIPEVMLPNVGTNWIEYADPTNITQEMKDLGKEFLKRINIDIKDAVLTDIATSPLQAIVRFQDGTGILSPVGPTNHGVMIEGVETNCVDISDSYWQEEKQYALNCIFFLKKFIIKENTMTIADNTLVQLVEGQGGFFLALDGVLRTGDAGNILASFIMRNKGNINDPTKYKDLTQIEFDSFIKQPL